LVNVYAVPNAEFVASPETTTVADPLITFTDATTGATVSQWNWSFGNIEDSSSTQQNPVFNYVEAGSYVVNLVVTTANGCSDSVQHTVFIADEFTLYVPNAFTPDGNETNDVFFPKGMGIDKESYRLSIFDRWGTVIFETTDWDKGWDGKVQGKTELVQQDVYVWKIEIKTWRGEKKSLLGKVTVVR
jgi:gliding motility-associated-like protein